MRSSNRSVLLAALLALVGAQTALGVLDYDFGNDPPPPTSAIAAPPPYKCKSFYEVLKATPSLSNLYKTVSLMPEMKKLLSDKNAKWTFIAPTNKAIKKPSSKLNKAQVADLLKQHIIKGVYADQYAWADAFNKAIPRLAGGPLTALVAVVDNFKEHISTYIVDLNLPSGKSTGVRLTFPSNKPNPGIPTCQGVLYTSDKAIPYYARP